ncbi:MAG TPA: CBS domain-containing protein [Gemmatimonadales bacterium]|nr:CBS domain-containing protein [Gemmatimonadales bacterium]
MAFLLELTGDIGVLPALLIASAAAHGVTVLLVTREYIVNPLARVRGRRRRPRRAGQEGRPRPVLGTVGPGATVGEAASHPLIVAHPDDLLAHAVDRMVRHSVGRLLVVDPRQPTRLAGYLGRTGVADALCELLDEEEIQEAG